MGTRGRDEQGFLSRWSARKQYARQDHETGADQGGEKLAEMQTPASGETAGSPQAGTDQDLDLTRLPPVESLEKDSDFSVFMHEKVPDALRRRALRRLWRVDPVFAHLDGMNDYDEDYTDAALVVEGLKTVYQVGKGMLREDPEAKEAADEAAPDRGESEEANEDSLVLNSTGKDPEASGESTAANRADGDSYLDVIEAAESVDEGVSESDRAALESAISKASEPVPKTRGTAARRRWGYTSS